MKNAKAISFGLLLVALLVLMVGGILFLLWSAPPAIAAVIAAGMGFIVSRVYESYKEGRQRLYDRKRDVYANLLHPFRQVLVRTIIQEDHQPELEITKELIEQATTAAFDAILYASDDVVRAYGDLRHVPERQTLDPSDWGLKLSRLLKAMRKDLGYTFTTLSDIEMLRMFINFKPGEEEAYRGSGREPQQRN